jgi:hypothetical protein
MERRLMVGGARPLAELDALLAAAVDGRGRSAIVLGEPGMGKTTLAEALADRALESGVTVAWGWCSAADMPPFWPWRTILRELAPEHRLAGDGPAAHGADGLGVPHPVAALEAARRALAPGGSVIVMEENVAESFTAPGDEVERFMAAAGTLWCVPQGRTEAASEVVGPLEIRPATMRRLSATAGFGTIEILPIEHPFWRFYRLQE